MDLFTIRAELMSGKSIYDLNLRVTYYTRVSTSKDEQLNSLKNQIQYYDDFIKSVKNWEFVEGYIDEGITGTSTTKRDAFNEMIEDGRNKKFDLIITKEISRFARNTLDSLFYTRELLKAGVGVWFQSENIHTLSPDAELRLAIMSSIAQEESRKISERVKWGFKRAIDNGKVMGSSTIWGYDKKDGKLTVNQDEAIIVRYIFDWYCQGFGIRKITEKLTKLGYKNSNGNPIGLNSIQGILTNAKYKGYYVGGKSTIVDFITKEKKHHTPDKWIMYKDNGEYVPEIVNEEVWNKANHILKERSDKMKSDDKTSYQNKYLYSGKIVCMQHNISYWRNLYKYKSGEKEVWQCKEYRTGGKKACSSPMLYKHELDEIMKSILNEVFTDKKFFIDKLTSIYAELLKEHDYDKDIKELLGKIEQIKKRKDKILDKNIDGEMTDEEFKERNNRYNQEIEAIQQQISKYEELNDSKNDAELQLKYITKSLQKKVDFQNEFNEEIVKDFLEKIEVYDSGNPEVIKLKVILKTGIEIPALYKFNSNMRLLPETHMVCNKHRLIFTRKYNNIDTSVTAIVDVIFNIAV